MNKSKLLGFATTGMYLLGSLGFTSAVFAGSLTPQEFEAEMMVNETVSLEREVTLDNIPVSKIDILFIADNTGSMGPAIENVKANAQILLQQLESQYDDIEIGVARYYGDISEGINATDSYQLLEPVAGGTREDVITAINNWEASDGGDTPEGGLFALHQAATSGAFTQSGYGTGYNTQWRSKAKKIIVWFGDAYSHTSTVNLQETVNALTTNDVSVIGINITSANSLLDGINKYDQALTLAVETGGNYASSYSSYLTDTIQDLIANSTTTLDLVFASEGDTNGLDITYTCIDPLGCEAVPSGETRAFRMDVTGNSAGMREFDTVVLGVNGAVANNMVEVKHVDPD